jgi:toxin HigB-1
LHFRFNTRQLSDLYYHPKGSARYPQRVVTAFFRVMTIIESAPDESTLRQSERLHYEKLQGKRGETGQRSMVLHDRWRLIVRIETDAQGKQVLVLEISNHYE